MTSEVGEVVWKKGEQGEENHAEIWDDTVLIQAYDKAISQMKVDNDMEQETHHGPERQKKSGKHKHTKSKRKWRVGDHCQATYSEDGLRYDAQIKSINEDGTCTIEYLGYGNVETLQLRNLFPQEKPNIWRSQESCSESDDFSSVHFNSSGRSEQACYCNGKSSGKMGKNKKPSLNNQMSSALHNLSQSLKLPLIPPPPPPFLMDDAVLSEEESLASMLMSWYMSGYHTGYYQGIRQIQQEKYRHKM